ncbi:tetratricopeptide repeat protein [Amycolatopsis rhizosphaerae]|uniref:Tetratricopeptide repeat protein n=1 Tax=Amycolatopsis rhizosphaerae TaxID=2053003 RepID=A0A558DNC1_9PSEU|nr:XRE family transcriptional regulator [Amycolatopsis rhizosphaerae]TVT62500.1 tetratricopeptide repeat protein [Amycolatopsis rhizosphaerae]
MDESDEQSSVFGQLLLSHRRAAGLSQSALARRSGVSIRALRDLERGRAQAAQQRSAEVLADALNLAGAQRELFLRAAKEGRRRVPKVSGAAAPCVLPPRVPSLVGREDELDRLRSEAAAGGVVAIVGHPGVGKTALAIAAAHELSGRFPDGCFAIDLRGMDDQPLAARNALGRLLRALGVAPTEIPVPESEQASLLRMLLHNRRVLLVLDNASDEAHVRPLLATGPGCLTLVTCRRALAGLEYARWLWLDLLTPEHAVELLSAAIGADRVEAERAAAAELVELCGCLPLAVRIAGNRLANRPHWSLAHLVDELRDARTRLNSLSTGDLQLRSAFGMSYRRLSPAARLLFRRLAVVPGPDFGLGLAQVVTGKSEPEVRLQLEELAEANLVQATQRTGRFQFHDLIRIFAAERMEAEEEPAERDRLINAVLDHLLGTAISAGLMFFPDAQPGERFATQDDAAEWLDLEAGNWLAAQHVATRLGRDRDVLELARAMHWYSDSRWLHGPWDRIFALGVAAARALGSRQELAMMLNFLGWAQHVCLGDNEAGLVTHQEALAVATEAGDRQERAWAHAYLGSVLMRLGRLDEAREHAQQSCLLAGEFGFWTMQISVRNRLGRVLRAMGRYEEAIAVHRRLIEDAERHQDEAPQGTRLWMTGVVVEEIGHSLKGLKEWRQAAETFRDVRWVYTKGGMPSLAADAALYEGSAWREAGEYARARECLQLALDALTDSMVWTRRDEVLAELRRLPPADGGAEAGRKGP